MVTLMLLSDLRAGTRRSITSNGAGRLPYFLAAGDVSSSPAAPFFKELFRLGSQCIRPGNGWIRSTSYTFLDTDILFNHNSRIDDT